jgi:ergothioneine biosynthesis protein EgtB
VALNRREQLIGEYRRVRAATEALADPLAVEDQVVQSMPEASPTRWHRAHTTWFFETFVLARAVPGHRELEPGYRYLFNSYYVGVGERHPQAQRGLLSRPTVAEVARYRVHVDRQVLRWLEDAPSAAVAEHRFAVELGLHHEQQHQELLLTDIKHAFSLNPLAPVHGSTAENGGAVAGGWVEHPGGLVDVGHDGDGFAFDNEAPRHRVHLPPFALAAGPVTAGDWLAFMAEGGYRTPQLWLSDGWDRCRADGWSAPLYWRAGDGGWQRYTLAGWRPVDPAQPVSHVSFYEADAFARWAGARLPREQEWEALAAAGRLGDGGRVWEWTASSYAGYPGYRPFAGDFGEYNGKFMSNRMVLRGGSCATPAGHGRPTYRNFFTPETRWQFSGLRLARPA